MTREKIINLIGYSLLLGCFLVSLFRVLGRESDDASDGRHVIRFAHWQLEAGMREALDQLARDYEALHPEVRVEQIAIPERTYAQWVRTQLVGGTAPDIIQLGKGTDDEVMARFFAPISQWVERPNPYNEGGPLASVPWRATFLDDMQGSWAYRTNLLEYYGVPMSMFTIRVFYNRDLWRRLLGDTPPPETFDDFLALCHRVHERSAELGQPVLPVAGSKDNGPMLAYRLFASQTQRLIQELDLEHTLRPENTDIGQAFLHGAWSVDSSAYSAGLAITRDVALQMHPGFVQLGRDDAAFYFLQKRALMITSGSWDSPSFRAMADFELGVFPVPAPSREHPIYGANVLGPASESETGTGLTFGIVRSAANHARLIDFLHFITSQKGNATFSRISDWLPAAVGVVPAEQVRPFLPITDGFVAGFDPTLGSLGAGTSLAVQRNLDLLVGPAGSVAAFRDRMRDELAPAVREDLERYAHNTLLNLQRQDVIIAALSASSPPSLDDSPDKFSEMIEAQNRAESRRAWIVNRLATDPGISPSR